MIIDTDTNCTPHTKALKDRGVTAIGRYYAAKGSKRLTKAEAQSVCDAGLRLFTVYEDSGDPELTVARGVRDAGLALAQARAIGQPEGTAIYFAMEHLPSGYSKLHVPGIKLYFEGIKQTFAGAYQVGCYSNGTTLAALLDEGLIDYAWVSASTSFEGSKDFLKTNRWHLAQRKVDQNWGGVSTDTNDSRGEFGSWALPARDSVDVAVRQIVQAPMAGSVAGAVAATVPAVADKPALMDRLAPNAAKVEELAGQGSRIAEHLRAFKAMIWKGAGTAVALGGGASTLVDPNKGNAQVVGSWAAQHPLLLAALVAVAVAVVIGGVAYYYAKKIEKGLVSAAADGRYTARGAQA